MNCGGLLVGTFWIQIFNGEKLSVAAAAYLKYVLNLVFLAGFEPGTSW